MRPVAFNTEIAPEACVVGGWRDTDVAAPERRLQPSPQMLGAVQKSSGNKELPSPLNCAILHPQTTSPIRQAFLPMSCLRARFTALAIALICSAAAHAQGQGLQLRPSTQDRSKSESSPVVLDADRIEGVPGRDTTAQGNASLRRGDLSIRAETLKYREKNENVEALGNVRLERSGDILSGPALRYSIKDETGIFEKPEFILAPRKKSDRPPVSVRGQADTLEFLGENRFRIKDGFFTSCKPGDDGWRVNADELDLDFTRGTGTARGARIYFEGVPIIAAPSLDFPLDNQRNSGFLPPAIGTSGKSGPEVAVPYYLNLAPSYDLTLIPRYMEKRGLQIAEQFRYLQRNYSGEFNAEVLPHDKAADLSRSAMALVHTYNRDGMLLGGLNLNKVSDDNYFRDLATRINITSQVALPREGFLTYNGNWWQTGSYSATARVQRFQILQDPENPVLPPYSRTPQLTLSAVRPNVGGFDFASALEFVDFSHPTLINGMRSTLYPSLSLPLVTSSAFLTPKVGFNYTYYSLDQNGPGTAQVGFNPGPSPVPEQNAPGTPGTITRALPIYSLDSGLIFERDTQLQGQAVTQTLEPRLYYVRIPFRNQNQIPLFDTSVADFSYAQIFSENMFAGGDRINDANQLTAAVTSRMLLPSSGQEVLRGTLGQRYYFEDQQVTLLPTDVPRTYNVSNLLAAVSGRASQYWTMDAATEYDQRDLRTERLTLAARYRPEGPRTLNLSYRYLSGDITRTGPTKQIDLSAQWPLVGRWYGVGRFNYSLIDSRIVEAIGGLEYGADCWVSRIVVQRFALTADTSSSSLFLQLELNGFSRLGSNPLDALKRNVPGYQRINALSPDTNPERPFDLYN
ncbi:MAG TPA: LPS-assembly protein LptD [Burkholderiales bacterium]